MSIVFTNSLLRDNDIRETLVFMIAAADPQWIDNVSLTQFERGLIDEVNFLLPGDEEDKRNVEHYIRDHGKKLHQIAVQHGQWEAGTPLMTGDANQLQAGFSVENLGPIAETGTCMYRFEDKKTFERKLVIAHDEGEAWQKLGNGKYLEG